MHSVKLPSSKSLFQLQAERLIRVQELAGANPNSIHWYIMTSENTKEAIRAYFEKNDFFKMDKETVHFFEQGTAPCFSKDGKVLLDQKSKISRAPDGNGGLFKALVKSNVLDHIKNRGVKYIHIYCVDNILVRIADPLFIGYCIERDADCAAKVRHILSLI
jgi:UDP-N-acetylglucosamine/UDP-N-acetylgalactosamine diphosphorylase